MFFHAISSTTPITGFRALQSSIFKSISIAFRIDVLCLILQNQAICSLVFFNTIIFFLKDPSFAIYFIVRELRVLALKFMNCVPYGMK